MRSISLLPTLEQVPLRAEHCRYNWTDVVKQSAEMRNKLFAIEVSAGAEVALMGIFDARNVSDDLFKAYNKAFPNISTDHSLYERYVEMVERGPESVTGFISNVKGKLAELRISEHLQQEFPGYPFNIADSQNQPVWDISAISPDGLDEVLIQVKVGGVEYASDVLIRMQNDSDVLFAVSNEIRERILSNHPELAAQFVNLDLSNFEFTSGVEENMNVLKENFGIDVPDAVGDYLPYLSELVLGIRILYDIVKVERDFKTVAIDDRGRIHAMKVLIFFQRFGISTVCTTVGGSAGTAIVPGFGTAGGAIGGALLATYLNNRLKPHTTEIAMSLFHVNEDDIFYFRNKEVVDRIGGSLARTATSL